MRITANITSVANYLPDTILTNADLEKLVDTSDEWILNRCGIGERRILKDKDKATAFMGAEAAKKALHKRGMNPEEIELVILCTATPEHQFPATANIVSDMIGAVNAWSFDVMAGCSGFIYALTVASKFIETGTHKKVLVIGSDKMSSIVDYTDRNTCVLFGDAAAAVILEPSTDGYGVVDSKMYSDGAGMKQLYQIAGGSLNPCTKETVEQKQHHITMDGKGVFKVAVIKMAEVAVEMMERNNLIAEDIAYLTPHQANGRIIEATAKHLGLSMDKVIVTVNNHGNTSAASIPLALDVAYKNNKIKIGDILLLEGFGAGYTWGGCLIKL
jgi:3-oxoacyl-[acyl-carrier-protein] synthase-3